MENQAAAGKPNKRRRRLTVLVSILAIIVAFMILSTLLANWANRHYADFKVNGSAMAPALTSGKVVLVKKTTTFRIDDIVVFKITYHSSTPKELIDRVVALSGDRVVISGNKLSVYDSSHQNGYNPSTGYDPNVNTVGNVSLTVPVGYVYVLGDNRSDSLDSRTFGPLAKSAVIGTVVPGS